MSADPHNLNEFKTRLELAKGSPTLLAGIIESDEILESSTALLADILRASPLQLADLGICARDAGPAKWAADSRRVQADTLILRIKPYSRLQAVSFAQLLNAQREHLRDLGKPLILMMSTATHSTLRTDAPDFFTWISAAYEIPSLEALQQEAARLGIKPDAQAMQASPEEPIRFLHISDIHLRPSRIKRYDQDRVLLGLLRFLERDRETFPLDLILVTGDLAQSGKAEEYALVGEFLQALMKTCRVPAERMFVVPGNHDIDRDIGHWLLRTLSGDNDALLFFTEKNNRRFHEQKFSAYAAHMRGLFGNARPLGLGVGAQAVELIDFKGIRLGIASFNSAWFAQGDDDANKLWLGEANVKEALDAMADGKVDFAIALMHHPLDNLSEIEHEIVERWIERGFDIVARGHVHKAKPRSLVGARGAYVELAGPAAYQGSQWGNGCYLGEIRVRGRTLRIRPYKYVSAPDPWVLNAEVFPDDERDGYCKTFTVPEKTRFKSSGSLYLPPTPPIDIEAVRVRLKLLTKQAEVFRDYGKLDEALQIYREQMLPLCDSMGDVRERAVTRGHMATILRLQGEYDEALRINEQEQLPVFEKVGDQRERVYALGQKATILRYRGQLEAALKLCQQDILPTIIRLNDSYLRILAMRQIAKIHKARREYGEALKIFQEDVLPAIESTGDIRFRTIVLREIAGVLVNLGGLGQASDLLQNEVCPVFEKLGLQSSLAIAYGELASVYEARGETERALQTLRDKALPMLERLGFRRELLLYRMATARCLRTRNQAGDVQEAEQLLRLALKDAEYMRIPEADEIRTFLRSFSSPPSP